MLLRRDILTGGLALALLPASARAASDEEAATAIVATLLTDAHRALGSGEPAALYVAIGNAFDFATWERFLLGERAADFAPNQTLAFRAMLPGFLAHLYRDQFDRGLDQPPTLGEARKARRDILVGSTFPRKDGRDLPVDWRLREIEGLGPRIIDVMIAGTSFLLLKRDEFAAILQKGGPDALLAYMRERIG